MTYADRRYWTRLKRLTRDDPELLIIGTVIALLIAGLFFLICVIIDEAVPPGPGRVAEKEHHEASTTMVCVAYSQQGVCTSWVPQRHPERWELIIREDATGDTDGVFVSRERWNKAKIGDRWEPTMEGNQ